jgi:hypothetical protein
VNLQCGTNDNLQDLNDTRDLGGFMSEFETKYFGVLNTIRALNPGVDTIIVESLIPAPTHIVSNHKEKYLGRFEAINKFISSIPQRPDFHGKNLFFDAAGLFYHPEADYVETTLFNYVHTVPRAIHTDRIQEYYVPDIHLNDLGNTLYANKFHEFVTNPPQYPPVSTDPSVLHLFSSDEPNAKKAKK